MPPVLWAEPSERRNQYLDIRVIAGSGVEDQPCGGGGGGADYVQRKVESDGQALQRRRVGQPGAAVGSQVMHGGARQPAKTRDLAVGTTQFPHPVKDHALQRVR